MRIGCDRGATCPPKVNCSVVPVTRSVLVAALAAYAEARGKALDNLLFTYDDIASRPAGPPVALASAGDLGLTEPTAGGRRYRHGTLSAYTAGRCRCAHCRAGFAEYRARRRAEGHDEPRGVRTRQTDGHLRRDWFRRQLWLPACLAAGIDPPIRLHDLGTRTRHGCCPA